MVIKAIIFDLDGTLINSIETNRKTFKKAMKEFGIIIKDEEINRINGMGKKEIIKYLTKEKGLKISLKNIIKYIKEKNKIKKEIMSNIKEYPEVKPAIKKLNKYELAVATSSKKKYLEENLERFGLKKYFKIRTTIEEVKESKPEPEMFLITSNKIGVKPEECLVIEDSINGIIAAKKARMKSIAVLTTTPREEFIKKAKPDAIIKSMKELTPQLISRL